MSAIVYPTGEVGPGALEVGPVDRALAPDPDEPPGLLVGDLPILKGRTLYTRFGDIFAWGCAIASAGMLALPPSADPAAHPRRADHMPSQTAARLDEIAGRLEALRGSL